MRKTDNDKNRTKSATHKVVRFIITYPKDINTLFCINMKKIFTILIVLFLSSCTTYKAVIDNKIIVPNDRYGNFIVVLKDSTDNKVGIYVRPNLYFKKEVGDTVIVKYDKFLNIYEIK